jgi:predicted NUDIX family NTP pyrophosphohydrolase
LHMSKVSAGLLVYRYSKEGLEVLLAHPGGPFWKNKDLGAWSIPKGEVCEGEDLLAAAHREFVEETGARVEGPTLPLGAFRQRSGKIVHAWAVRSDFDPSKLRSNTFELEWPPHSGRQGVFPEVDRADWFDIPNARQRILPGQLPILEKLIERLDERNVTGGNR